ncbi:MAG: creatininase family protein, partial [Thermomicrobia bacterium]|nr:creatininase family protein [Thermomicrobia bacterium]
PHLPLDTDVHIAVGAADRAAALLASAGMPALVLPPLAYGVSFVGTSFAGTLPVAVETMTALVSDLLVGLDRYGCTAALIVNSHLEPAHADALNAGIAQAEAATDRRLRVAFPDLRAARWAALLSEEFCRGARHAGGFETALMLVQAPNAVREAERQRLPPVWIDLPAKLRAGAKTFAEAGATLGYFGDPASATTEEGHILFDALAHIYVTALRERLNQVPAA